MSSLSIDTYQSLAFSFAQKTAPMLSCRGCGKAGVKLYVCCQHNDGAPKAGDAQALCHSQCLECFNVKPLPCNMQAPGSLDKCRYCVQDKESGAMPRAAPIGDPIKRPRANDAFNQLAPALKQFADGVETLKGGEAGDGTALGDEMREGIRESGNSIKSFLEKKVAEDGYPGDVEGGQPALEAYMTWLNAQRSVGTAMDAEATAAAVAEAERRAAARATAEAQRVAADQLRLTQREERRKAKEAVDAEKAKTAAATATATAAAQRAAAATAAAAANATPAQNRGGQRRAQPSAAARAAANVPKRSRGVGESEGRKSQTPKALAAAAALKEAQDNFTWFHDNYDIQYGKNGKAGTAMLPAMVTLVKGLESKKRKYHDNFKDAKKIARTAIDALVKENPAKYTNATLVAMGLAVPADPSAGSSSSAAAATGPADEEDETAASPMVPGGMVAGAEVEPAFE